MRPSRPSSSRRRRSSGETAATRHAWISFRDGTAFTMSVEARAGGAYGYDATIPAGQVGLWCSDSSDNEFDNFQVRDLAGPFVADARWFSSTGEVRVDNSDNNVLESFGSLARISTIVRRGCRVDEYVATYKFKWSTPCEPGIVVRWPLTRRVPLRGHSSRSDAELCSGRCVQGWLDPLDPALRRQGQAGNWPLTRVSGKRSQLPRWKSVDE